MIDSARPRRSCRLVIASLAALSSLLVACTVGPDYVPPEPEMPDEWHRELADGLETGEANLEAWWTELQDPTLEELIDKATKGNLNLQIAFERVLQSRAMLGGARGEFYPTIDGQAGYDATKFSEEEIFGALIGGKTNEIYSIGAGASWEIDLFGRVRRSVESATAGLDAAVENYRDGLVILYAEIALTYIDVRTLQKRIAYARGNAEAQRGTLQLTQDRLAAQIASELDVRQAELNLASTESFVPALRIGLARAIHRLSVLIGEHPSALYDVLGVEADIPDPPQSVVVSIPADLVRQRPDIRRAERLLASQTAQIGVATADLYPRLTLNGSVGLSAQDFSNVTNGSAFRWGFSPSLTWNLLDGGRIRNNILAQNAMTRESYIGYENTVLLALEEVENALAAYALEQERRDDLERAVLAAQQSVTLVDQLYRSGLTDFQNVLDTQRSLFQQQDQLAESEGLVVKELVNLYKALGGGWTPDRVGEEENGEGDGEPQPENLNAPTADATRPTGATSAPRTS